LLTLISHIFTIEAISRELRPSSLSRIN
jgi:hypothetical protein